MTSALEKAINAAVKQELDPVNTTAIISHCKKYYLTRSEIKEFTAKYRKTYENKSEDIIDEVFIPTAKSTQIIKLHSYDLDKILDDKDLSIIQLAFKIISIDFKLIIKPAADAYSGKPISNGRIIKHITKLKEYKKASEEFKSNQLCKTKLLLDLNDKYLTHSLTTLNEFIDKDIESIDHDLSIYNNMLGSIDVVCYENMIGELISAYKFSVNTDFDADEITKYSRTMDQSDNLKLWLEGLRILYSQITNSITIVVSGYVGISRNDLNTCKIFTGSTLDNIIIMRYCANVNETKRMLNLMLLAKHMTADEFKLESNENNFITLFNTVVDSLN